MKFELRNHINKMLQEVTSKLEVETMYNNLQPGEYLYIEDFNSNSYDIYPGDKSIKFNSNELLIKVVDDDNAEIEVDLDYNLVYKLSVITPPADEVETDEDEISMDDELENDELENEEEPNPTEEDELENSKEEQ